MSARSHGEKEATAEALSPGGHYIYRWSKPKPTKKPSIRTGIIRARPLGEAFELLSGDETQPSEDELAQRKSRRKCSAGATLTHTWLRAVEGAVWLISDPRANQREEHVNSLVAGPTSPRTCAEGAVKLLSVVLWDIIYPDSVFRTSWDVFILVLLMYVAFITTFMLCFDVDKNNRVDAYDILDLVVDAFFLLDVVFNFRSGIRKGSTVATRHSVVTDRRKIAIHYLTSWFVVDVVAGLPWAHMPVSLGSYMQLTKLLRLMRLLRLLKLPKSMKRNRMFKGMEEQHGVAIAQLALYVCLAVLVLHLSASAWFFTAYMEDSSTLAGTWAKMLEHSNTFQRYLTSLYFVVITFTTVGYGDVYPVTTVERVMACIGMMIGVVTLGYIISTANSIMGNANKYETAKAEIRDRLEAFLSRQTLPPGLAFRIAHFYDYVSKRQFNDAGDAELLDSLPIDLRGDVLRSIHSGLVRAVPFLQSVCGLQPGLVVDLTARLQLQFFGRDECVVMEGGWDTDMYFITEGNLKVRQYTSVQPVFLAATAPPGDPPARSAAWAAAVAAAQAAGEDGLGGIGGGGGGAAEAEGQGDVKGGVSVLQRPGQRSEVALELYGWPVPPSLFSPYPRMRSAAAAGDEGRMRGGQQDAAEGFQGTSGDGSGKGEEDNQGGRGGGGDGLVGGRPTVSPFASLAALPPHTGAAPTAAPDSIEQEQHGHRHHPQQGRLQQQQQGQWCGSVGKPAARRPWRMRYDDQVPQRDVRSLKRGDYFGEYACLTGCPRTATVVTRSMTELYCLSRADLGAAMARWPRTLAAWKKCSEFGKQQRAALRSCFPGGRAPLAASLVVDLVAEHSAGDGAGCEEPPAMGSQARYEAFLKELAGSMPFASWETPPAAGAFAARETPPGNEARG